MFVQQNEQHEDGERREHYVLAYSQRHWHVWRIAKDDVRQRRRVGHIIMDVREYKIV